MRTRPIRDERYRVLAALGEQGEFALDELGPRVRVDYDPDGEHGRAWLRGLLADLANDGLVELRDDEGTMARLGR